MSIRNTPPNHSTPPLEVKIVNGILSITLSVERLAFAVSNDGKLDGYNVTNAAKFAEDVLHELKGENEVGETMVSDLLDAAADMAIENGSEWVVERPETENFN